MLLSVTRGGDWGSGGKGRAGWGDEWDGERRGRERCNGTGQGWVEERGGRGTERGRNGGVRTYWERWGVGRRGAGEAWQDTLQYTSRPPSPPTGTPSGQPTLSPLTIPFLRSFLTHPLSLSLSLYLPVQRREGETRVLQDSFCFSHQLLLRVKELIHLVLMSVWVNGTEEGINCHQGHNASSGYARNSYNSLD